MEPTISETLLNTTPLINKKDDFSLLVYIILALVYILIVHLAVDMGGQFNLMQMVLFFVLGGVLGYLFLGYQFGFVLAVVLSLIFMSSPKDL